MDDKKSMQLGQASDLEKKSLKDDEIVTTRLMARRSFVKKFGLGLLTATGVVVGLKKASASDSKPNNDSDTTSNADLKAVDSDQHNSKVVDTDRSRLRDYKKKGDSD